MTGKTLHQKPDSKDSRRLSASLESPEDWLVGLNGSPAALSSEGLEVWRERWRPRLTVFISEPDLPQPLQITAPAWRLAAFQPRQAPGTSTSLNPCRGLLRHGQPHDEGWDCWSRFAASRKVYPLIPRSSSRTQCLPMANRILSALPETPLRKRGLLPHPMPS